MSATLSLESLNIEDFDSESNLLNNISPGSDRGSLYFTIDQFNSRGSDHELFLVSYNVRSCNRNIDSVEAMLCSMNTRPDWS